MSTTRFLLLLFSLANLLLCHLGQAVVHITFDYRELAQITKQEKWTFTAQLMKQDENTGVLMRSEKEETHAVTDENGRPVIGREYDQTVSLSVSGSWLAKGPVLMTVEVGAAGEETTQIDFSYGKGGQRIKITMKKDELDKPMYGLLLDDKRKSPKAKKEGESSKRPTPYQRNNIHGSNVRPINQLSIGTNSNVVHRPDQAGSDHARSGSDHTRFVDNQQPPYQHGSFMGLLLRNDHHLHTGQNVQQMPRNQNVRNDLHNIGQGSNQNHGLAHYTDLNIPTQSQQYPRINSNMPFWNPHGLGMNTASLSGTHSPSSNAVLDPHNLNDHFTWDQFINHVVQTAPHGKAVQHAQMHFQPALNAASQPVAIFDSSRYGHKEASGNGLQNQRHEIVQEAWPASSASGSGLTASSSAAAHQQQQETSKFVGDQEEEGDDSIQNLLNVEEQGNFDDIFSSSKWA